MFLKRLIFAAVFAVFLLTLQSLLFGLETPPNISHHSLIKMPNQYTVNEQNSDGCCPGLRRRFRRALGSCFGCSCCSSSSDEEEDEVELEDYRSVSGSLPSVSSAVETSDFRVTSINELDQKTQAEVDNLKMLMVRYDGFGCSPGDTRPACIHLGDRIKQLRKKLLRKGVVCTRDTT